MAIGLVKRDSAQFTGIRVHSTAPGPARSRSYSRTLAELVMNQLIALVHYVLTERCSVRPSELALANLISGLGRGPKWMGYGNIY